MLFRSERIHGQTMSGLPAATEGTPLDRVPRPGPATDTPIARSGYSAPAFETKKKKTPTTTYIGIGIAAVILILLLVIVL